MIEHARIRISVVIFIFVDVIEWISNMYCKLTRGSKWEGTIRYTAPPTNHATDTIAPQHASFHLLILLVQ